MASVLASVVPLLALPASAQGPTEATFEITSASVAGQPVTMREPGNLTLDWVYTVPPAAVALQAVNGVAVLEWGQFQCTRGMQLSGPTRQPIRLEPGRLAYEGSSSFLAVPYPSSPGVVPFPCTARGTVSWGSGGVPSTATDEATFDVSVAYVGAIDLHVENLVIQTGPGRDFGVGLRITNSGNARTRLAFSMDLPDSWTQAPMEPVVLDVAETASFDLVLQAPGGRGWNNREQPFTLDVVPWSTDDPSLPGEGMEAHILVQVQGIGPGEATPGPGPALPLVLVAIAALLRRR